MTPNYSAPKHTNLDLFLTSYTFSLATAFKTIALFFSPRRKVEAIDARKSCFSGGVSSMHLIGDQSHKRHAKKKNVFKEEYSS